MINNSLLLLIISNAVASIGTGVAMIAIPWLLVSGVNGVQHFGFIATMVNSVLFFATPLIGPAIDKHNRKNLMILLRIGFVLGLFAVFILTALKTSNSDIYALLVYYVIGASFYAINVPLRSAFVQELFDPDQYLKVNSILEIENQVAAVITGVLAIFVVEHYGLQILAAGNILAFVVAIGCISLIKPVTENRRLTQKRHILAMLTEGLYLVFCKKEAALLLIASTIPYIVVILYTILHPIAISQLPEATGSTYALIELLFAIGAIAGGLALGYFTIEYIKLAKYLPILIMIFTLVAVLQALFPTYYGFILLAGAFGFFNAAVRILRQSILMHEFNDYEVGRVGAFLQSWIMFARAIFIAMLTILIHYRGSSSGLWFAAGVASLPIAVMTIPLFLNIYRKKRRFNRWSDQRDKTQV